MLERVRFDGQFTTLEEIIITQVHDRAFRKNYGPYRVTYTSLLQRPAKQALMGRGGAEAHIHESIETSRLYASHQSFRQKFSKSITNNNIFSELNYQFFRIKSFVLASH